MSRPARGKRLSLVAALFGRTGLLLLAVIACVGAIAFFTAQARVKEVYDGQLIIGANVLRALMTEELRNAPPGGEPLEIDDDVLLSQEDRQAFDDFAEWRMFRIWRGGRIAMRSDTGPQPDAPPTRSGFHNVPGPHNERWRIYTLLVPDRGVAVQVGERLGIRLVLVRGIAIGTALPLLLLVPLVAGLLWLSLNDGLGALRLLMAEMSRRSVRDLSPLSPEPWPRDLHPLVRAINRLFGRIRRAVQRERSFLDSAAHQLRTPLAAVKLQAQLIATETDPQERELLTQRLAESVDRATALTDSLLTLARLDAAPTAEIETRGDLRAEVAAAMADLAPLAARRDVELSFEGPDTAPAGDPVLLRLIAANLIENALHHAPAGSAVEVTIVSVADGLRLSVCDAGPGIAPEDRAKVVRRFYRGPRPSVQGAGLGLSIVAEAVRVLNGRLAFEGRPDGASGLCVIVALPGAGEV